MAADMCRKSGLPPPVQVRAGVDPALAGARASRAYGLGTRTYLAGRYVAHLELGWDRPIPGPILLGAGRHFGLGLMLPAMKVGDFPGWYAAARGREPLPWMVRLAAALPLAHGPRRWRCRPAGQDRDRGGLGLGARCSRPGRCTAPALDGKRPSGDR